MANWASELKAWRLKIAAAQAKLIVETGKERGGQAGTTKGKVAQLVLCGCSGIMTVICGAIFSV